MSHWFTQGASEYLTYRPTYPVQLAQYLASLVPQQKMAVDMGCGNGQFTELLHPYFKVTLGMDPSFNQLEYTHQKEGLYFYNACAEQIPLKDNSVDLMTAAQAAHWFQLDRFYREVNRILKPEAVIALISYGVPTIDSFELNERFKYFYYQDIAPYWPAERKLVDEGYQSIPFPFPALPTPSFTYELEWTLSQLIGYITTWSAFKHAHQQHQDLMLTDFFEDLESIFPDPTECFIIRWPMNIRAGKVLK
ncbi:MAG: class I SAM-dependent methyltransferase [Betaproteobacteria bacterium]|nr:methyltransferase domain-containing protein [Betaproteobacteria bacterium]MDE2424173.1 class I SAM-dependent methyltransferase [Betaproteobacteria bacterium]